MTLLTRWRVKDSGTLTRPGTPDWSTGTPPSAPQTKVRVHRLGATGAAGPTDPVVPPSGSTTYVLPGQRAGAADPAAMNYAIPTTGVIYVDAALGNDSNAGTAGAPVQTVVRANNLVAAGGTIVLRGLSATRQGSQYVYHEGTSIPLNGTGFDTTTVRNGIYAGISISKANVTVQPYPGEEVVFDGTSVQTGWTQSGAVWSKALAITHDRSATDSYGKLDNDARGLGWLWVRGQQWHDLIIGAGYTETAAQMFPMASWPEQVWIDGVKQRQVATLAEVVPGTFYVAGTAGGLNGVLWTSTRYHLGTDPTGKEVRVADRCTSLAAAADGVTIRGIKARRYANAVWHGGVFKIRSTHGTFENCRVEDAMVGYEHLSGCDDFAYVQCEYVRAGILGFKASGGYRGVYRRCRGTQANSARFNWAPVSGGVKMTTTRDTLLEDCSFTQGWTKGAWTDVSCYNIDYVNCDFSDNEQFGVVNEISANCRLINCNLSSAGLHGYLWHDTNDSLLLHCSIKDSGRLVGQVYNGKNLRPVTIFQDDRRVQDDTAYPSTGAKGGTYPNYGRDTRQTLTQNTIDLNNFVVDRVDIWNNVIDVGPTQVTQFAYIALEDLQASAGNSRDVSAYHMTVGGNLYCRRSATSPTWAFLSPLAGSAKTISNTLAAWRTATATDSTSREVIGASPTDADGNLTTAAKGLYGPGGSSAVPTRALTAEEAALIGVPVGTYPPGVIPIPVSTTIPDYTRRLTSGTTTAPASFGALGDSITFGAAWYGSTPPKSENSWPGLLRTDLTAQYGRAGSGWVLFNQDLYPANVGPFSSTNPDNHSWEPRMTFTGTMVEPTAGLHGRTAIGVPDGGTAPAAYVEWTDTGTEFDVLLLAGTGGVLRYTIDGGAQRTARATTSTATAVDTEAAGGTPAGHILLKFPLGASGQHTIRMWGSGQRVDLYAIRTLTGNGRIDVSNESQSGKSLGTLVGNNGSPYLSAMHNDVVLISLGANDYNAGVPLATAVANLNTVIGWVKAQGAVPLGMFPPQSVPSLWPGGTAPTYTAYVNAFASAYAAAGVPFLNLQKLFASSSLTSEQAIFDAGNAAGMYADAAIHLSDKGSKVVAAAVRTFLRI